jgi:site-specific recombinase XerD
LQEGRWNALRGVEQDFTHWMTEERGLVPETLRRYLPTVRRFVAERFGEGRIRFGGLRAQDITRFVVRYARRGSSTRAAAMSNALRTFLRFLRMRGDTAMDLAAVVPSVTRRRQATLPRGLEPHQVELLLSCCDRSTAIGRRDRAILLLLARLGLRAGEVAGLVLEDIDWESGQILVRGKGRDRSSLPLPQDTGAALARYLRRDRPRCSTRHVFVRARAPRREIGGRAIAEVVKRALGRAGLSPPHKGAHVLRHSLAIRMLRNGASLRQIGDLLRHRRIDTTAIYAKVDLVALRALAQPWPGGGA